MTFEGLEELQLHTGTHLLTKRFDLVFIYIREGFLNLCGVLSVHKSTEFTT